MRNLSRLTNAAQRSAAWEDWRWLTKYAETLNIAWRDYVSSPPENATAHTIDDRIRALKARIRITHPGEDLTLPSAGRKA